jgi:hypothetical protein
MRRAYVVSLNSSLGDVDAIARRGAIEKHGEIDLDLVCGSGRRGRITLQFGAQGKRPSTTADEERCSSSSLHLSLILRQTFFLPIIL